jgi:PAS domain S-box-containing protein
MLSRAALRHLMGQASGAGSLQAVYQAALRAVQDALDVDRASLLVFDASGTMRFVAWSGLTDTYRTAVDGHSPWSADETEATPLVVPDVEQDASLATYLPIFRLESIRALAFVPLQFGSRLLGKFMLYYREPHVFSDAEIATAEQIADHVAFALEHHRIAVALESRLLTERELRQLAESEAALRETNERRLHLALAAGRMGTWDWDVQRDRVSWSPELEIIHGLEPGAFEGTFDAFQRDVHPADADRLGAAVAAAFEAPESIYEIEYRIVRPDGTLRWLAATGRVIVDTDGRAARMLGICRDVTEHKRAEDARAFLADASRILATTLAPETIIESLAHLAVPSLADWCIVQATDAEGCLHPVEIVHQEGGRTALMWQFLRRWPSRPDMLGSTAFVASSGQSILISRITEDVLWARAERDPEQLQLLREMRLHSAITVPLQARGRTLGTLTLMSAESERVYDEVDLRIAEDFASRAAFAIDNAHLYRQAEEARLAAETARGQLEALTRVSDQIAVSLDPDEALRQLAVRVVPAFADYCVTYAAVEGAIRPLGFAHRDPTKASLVETLAHGVPVTVKDREGPGMVIRLGEPCLVRESDPAFAASQADAALPGGVQRALAPRSIMTVPLNARGHTLGAIVFAATDDSGRRFDHADLTIATELASRAALLVDNARLYAEARSAVRARDDMIAVISHDLRDPLQTISTAASAMRLAPQSLENGDSIESIALASMQMRRLVADLLDITLIEAGRLSIVREPVDLRDLLREAYTLLQPQIDAANVRIETRLAADLPPVSIDRHRVLQVLLNLMGNALKFGAAGGLVILGAERQDSAIRIWVEDTGVGIRPDQLDHVFDRFWQADRQAHRGAGLGLAVAKGVVEAHGGQIGVTSRPGAGSTFFFTLPFESGATGDERMPRDPALADARIV